MVAALASALTACGGSTPSVTLPKLAEPGPALTQPCDVPAALPARKLSQSEVEHYWGLDRAHLLICRDRKSGLVSFFLKRDGGAGAK